MTLFHQTRKLLNPKDQVLNLALKVATVLVRKLVVLIITKPIAKFNKPAAAVAAAVPAIDLSYATKVNVSGLPKDLKHDNIKVCFQTENLNFQ